MLEHRHRHRVHPVPHRDPLVLHQAQGHRGLERLHQDERGPVGEGGERDAHAAPGAGQRQGVEHPIGVGHAQDLAAPPGVGQAVAVADDRALRERRGAGRVEDGERIVGRDRAARGVERGGAGGLVARVLHVAPGEAAGIRIVGVHDHAPEHRELLDVELAGDRGGQVGQHLGERLEVVHRTGVIGAHEGGRVRLAQDVAQLVGLVARVQRHHHRADERAAVLGREPLRPVRHPERDLVALPDAQGEEALRDAARGLVEPDVGDAAVGRDDRLAAARAARLGREHVAHRRVQERVAVARRQHRPHATAGLYSASQMWKMEADEVSGRAAGVPAPHRG